MKATPADQRLLLDLAELDVRTARADAARRNPPQIARVRELVAQRDTQGRELLARSNARDDVKAELARVESDIDIARKRSARDADRLSQTAVARDARALEQEIEALAVRVDGLETTQLELMERLQDAEEAVAEQQQLVARTSDEGQRLSAEGKDAVARATAELDSAQRDRAAVAERVSAGLLAEYERIGARTTAAGLLQQATCGACRVMLSPSDIARIREAASDDVVTCPECGAILIRTEESGL
ncbi:zinc ribbon domain-containing protein [Microbacterium indicum]|uniref:zinc ribbon domain-containing protein n=1 Tax=Microbacterium indicum TaxID=358100 RepID=UPI00048CDB93|nr:C4-type zinc ribbon domain-containing protein [Microbacterium indicum]